MHYGRVSSIGLISGFVILTLMVASCGSSLPDAGSQGGLTSTPTSTTVPDSTSTTTPGQYNPSYDTIAGLANDAQAVFVGTVKPFFQDPSNGGLVAPVAVDHLLEGVIPRLEPEPELPQGQPGDVAVVVGDTYLVFWSEGTTGETSCAVGGTRGLFNYDPATQTATRTSTQPSQIPTTISLAQVTSQLPSFQPSGPEVPVCSPSLTGSAS